MAPDVPSRLKGDAGRLRQILVNLVGNALKFTPRGGVSTLVRVESRNGSAVRLHVTVVDTGIGIPGSKLEAIFQPFQQADGSTTRQFGGTGLGLSIVQRLVDMMRGRVWVESTEGSGSRFHFVVEFETAADETKGTQSSQDAAVAVTPLETLPPLKVLAAEDNLVNRTLLQRVLERSQHTVTLVGDGRAAVEMLARESFDVVLMDMQMPVLCGREATLAIRDAERASGRRRVPIIALTANAKQEDREECRRAGMDGYVAKPIRRQELFAEIARVWRGARAASASGISAHDVLQRVEHESAVLEALLEALVSSAPALVSRLAGAARAGNTEAVRSLAHELHGAVSPFGASELRHTASELESAARTAADFDLGAVERLESELSELIEDLRAILRDSSSAAPHDAPAREVSLHPEPTPPIP